MARGLRFSVALLPSWFYATIRRCHSHQAGRSINNEFGLDTATLALPCVPGRHFCRVGKKERALPGRQARRKEEMLLSANSQRQGRRSKRAVVEERQHIEPMEERATWLLTDQFSTLSLACERKISKKRSCGSCAPRASAVPFGFLIWRTFGRLRMAPYSMVGFPV